MTCKDCYHYDVCYAVNCLSEFPNCAETCKSFKDKSLILELPCKFGDTVYYLENTSIKKGIVRQIWLGNYVWVVVSVSKSKCVVVKYDSIYLTREEAERKLKELKDG